MPPSLIIDPTTINVSDVVADKEAIRRVNPQRHEMEHLDAIVFEDTENHICVGYKDVRPDEFWVRGHMPGFPLLPGVLMCEAAAQLCSYYAAAHKVLGGDFIAFGGMEGVRFRGPVHVGSRLLLLGKATKIHRRQTVFNVQGLVDDTMVFHADIIGTPFYRKEES